MKVQGPGRPRFSPLEDAGRVKDAKTDRASQPSGERVAVSNQSRLLSEARGAEVPDTARVEKLKDAIRNGQFKVDPDRIAEAMIREEI